MSMSDSEKRIKYRDILGDGRFTSKGGAGLGLLDIIRSSDGNFFYDILPSEFPDHRLLYLKIKISKND
jgi:hypothetical protein